MHVHLLHEPAFEEAVAKRFRSKNLLFPSLANSFFDVRKLHPAGNDQMTEALADGPVALARRLIHLSVRQVLQDNFCILSDAIQLLQIALDAHLFSKAIVAGYGSSYLW